jgi:hypothetical protein
VPADPSHIPYAAAFALKWTGAPLLEMNKTREGIIIEKQSPLNMRNDESYFGNEKYGNTRFSAFHRLSIHSSDNSRNGSNSIEVNRAIDGNKK